MKLVHFLEKMEKNRDVLRGVSLIVLGLLIIFDTLWVGKEHTHTAFEKIPDFWAIFGFISSVIIIIFSKWLGYLGITKQENFYDD